MQSTPTHHRWALPLALVLALLGPVLLAPVLLAPAGASPATAQAGEVAIDLEGAWRFMTGDDPAWADPDFDDRSWEEVQVPAEGGQPIFADYDGFAWFRLEFDLPAGIEGTNLVASLGFIDDADVTYLNGLEVGRTGVLPPDADSQWFERRLYPVPAEAPVFGGRNVMAVRMNDFSGGGGWYDGPVGLFSKSALREAVYGITGPAATAAIARPVLDLLDAQAEALADGDAEAYLDTLDGDYVHDGRDAGRRGRDIRAWIQESGSLTLTDAGVEVVAADDGRLLVDTNRTISGTRDGEPFDFQPAGQQFLVIDPGSGLEVGNRSRFFRDHVESEVEGERREYVVYLPPSYYDTPDHDYPVVYLLHGINGGSREWEPRNFQQRLDRLYSTGGLAESIVVMPDGESLWYIDSSVTPWRSMFTEEMVPQVDAEYRTLDERAYRGLSGVSMGGHGTFTIGWAHPELFSSLATHMGALDFPPLVGGPEEIAANTPETPVVQVTGHTPDFLDDFTYYFDACEDDDFAFDEAVRAMDGQLTAKGIEHTAVVFPEGRHNDDCWVPHIDASFGLHSDSFRASGLEERVPLRRIAGPDRVATALALAAEGSETADVAVLAQAGDFPDALAAGPLAIAAGGPLLLTDGDVLSPSVAAEIERLGVGTVYLAGGESALSADVADALEEMGLSVTRLGGADRYATAAAIAAEVADRAGSERLDGAIIARGDAFPDALAASALAATGPLPILLAAPAELPAVTAAALGDLVAPDATITLAGGVAALSADVADSVVDAGFDVDRRGGADRYATAVALTRAAVDRGADSDPLVVASGTAFPDALSAGVLAARLAGGILLVDPHDLDDSPASADLLAATPVSAVLVAGGPSAISHEVLTQIRERARRP